MNRKQDEQAGGSKGERLPGLEPLLDVLGLIVGNHRHQRWLSDSDLRDTVNEGFNRLRSAFRHSMELEFRLQPPDGLLVNQQEPEAVSEQARAFVEQLKALQLNSFTVDSRVARREFSDFMEILGARAEEIEQLGGLPDVLKRFKIDHVRIKRIVYREVDEDDVIVSRGGPAAPGGADAGDAFLARTVAILRGRLPASDPEAAAALKKALDDPATMAKAVLEVVEREAESATPPGRRAEQVGDALRQAYGGLLNSDATRTQKGKKQVRKSLAALETALSEQMAGRPPEEAEALSEVVADTIEELVEAVDIDTLASDYARKRNAIESSEARLLRFIRKRGLERVEAGDLPEKLIEGGLDRRVWQELLGRSGILAVAAGEDAGAEGPHPMRDVLDSLSEAAAKLSETDDSQASQEWTRALAHMNDAVSGILSDTRDRVAALQDAAASTAREAESTDPEARGRARRSHARMMKILGEIVQEICQPLSVVQSCLYMIEAGRLGELSEAQGGLLHTVTESVARVNTLVDALRGVVNDPSTLSPDRDIVSSLYE